MNVNVSLIQTRGVQEARIQVAGQNRKLESRLDSLGISHYSFFKDGLKKYAFKSFKIQTKTVLFSVEIRAIKIIELFVV